MVLTAAATWWKGRGDRHGDGPLGGRCRCGQRPKALIPEAPPGAALLRLRARVRHDVAEVLEEVRGTAARVGVVQRGQRAVLAVLPEVADLAGDVVTELAGESYSEAGSPLRDYERVKANYLMVMQDFHEAVTPA